MRQSAVAGGWFSRAHAQLVPRQRSAHQLLAPSGDVTRIDCVQENSLVMTKPAGFSAENVAETCVRVCAQRASVHRLCKMCGSVRPAVRACGPRAGLTNHCRTSMPPCSFRMTKSPSSVNQRL